MIMVINMYVKLFLIFILFLYLFKDVYFFDCLDCDDGLIFWLLLFKFLLFFWFLFLGFLILFNFFSFLKFNFFLENFVEIVNGLELIVLDLFIENDGFVLKLFLGWFVFWGFFLNLV